MEKFITVESLQSLLRTSKTISSKLENAVTGAAGIINLREEAELKVKKDVKKKAPLLKRRPIKIYGFDGSDGNEADPSSRFFFLLRILSKFLT